MKRRMEESTEVKYERRFGIRKETLLKGVQSKGAERKMFASQMISFILAPQFEESMRGERENFVRSKVN